MKLSVIIPVYNEERTVAAVVERVRQAPFRKEIIIVDDGSTDGTRKVLEELASHADVRVFLQPENRGKGACLRRGFEVATGDVIVIQDADMEYDPQDFAVLLEPIIRGEADVVYGSRFSPVYRRVNSYWHTWGNRALTTLSNWFTDLHLTDMETCYKVFRADIIKNIKLVSDRFGFEPEVTAKVAKIPGVRIFEVPISYHYRSFAEGKKIGWKDGVSAVARILYFNMAHDPEKAYQDDPQRVLENARETSFD
jgi:glycosyltransferase involved in cell wall biosynthesis